MQTGREVGIAARFMAEVDHKGEFIPGLAKAGATCQGDGSDGT